jgi:hypothetical protein
MSIKHAYRPGTLIISKLSKTGAFIWLQEEGYPRLHENRLKDVWAPFNFKNIIF